MGNSHVTGPWISKEGLKIGDADSSVEVIKSDGALADGIVTEDNLSALTAYSATGALVAGKPVYVSGVSTVDNATIKVALARANDAAKAAQFIVSTPATVAHKAVTMANVGVAVSESTEVIGTLLYLGATAAGVITTAVTTAPGNYTQPVGVVTKQSTAAGFNGNMKILLAYSQAVNPAST